MKPGIPTFLAVLGSFLLIVTGCSKSDTPPPPVTDADGNSYKTVRIGEQTWMAENLKTSKFSDGTDISIISDPAGWSTLETPGFCLYNNDGDSLKKIYGALYNFYAAGSGKLCPAGWHVPSDDDWQKLREFSADTLTSGGGFKEEGIVHWKAPNTGAVNNTGFTALPAGIRYFEGSFSSLSYFTSFWSSTEYDTSKGWFMSLYYGDAASPLNKASKKDGFSVRCIKD
jgi:uncharacterized protein (TIGR02145 family)